MKQHFNQLTAKTARFHHQQGHQQHLHQPQHFSISVYNHFGLWPSNAAVAAVPLAASVAPLPAFAATSTYALHEHLSPPAAPPLLTAHELHAPSTRSHSLCSNLSHPSFAPNAEYSSDLSRENTNASVAAATTIDFGVVVDQQMLQYPANFAAASNLSAADTAAIFPPTPTTSRGTAFAKPTSAPLNLDFPQNITPRGRANYGNFEFVDVKSKEFAPHRLQQQNLQQVRPQYAQLYSSDSDAEATDSEQNYVRINKSTDPLRLYAAPMMSGRGYGRKR